MHTYWELSEEGRAELTEREVERYIDAELMTKGVLRTRPLEVVPEPPLPEPDQTLFVVGNDWYSTGLGFLTAEAAMQARRQSLRLATDYINGQSFEVAHPLDAGHVKEVRAYSPAAIASARGSVEKATAARAENERRRETHRKQLDAEREALSGLWEDWHRCRSKAAHMARIVEVFEEYKRIAERPDIAGQFLLKVFGREEIAEAAKCRGVDIPLELEPTCEPVEVSAPSIDAAPL